METDNDIASAIHAVTNTGARIYEMLLPCLMLQGLLFNSIQTFGENNCQ